MEESWQALDLNPTMTTNGIIFSANWKNGWKGPHRPWLRLADSACPRGHRGREQNSRAACHADMDHLHCGFLAAIPFGSPKVHLSEKKLSERNFASRASTPLPNAMIAAMSR
jgi:hypothetical protein